MMSCGDTLNIITELEKNNTPDSFATANEMKKCPR